MAGTKPGHDEKIERRSRLLLQPVRKRRAVVALVADIAEHRQKFRGLEQSRHAGDFPRLPASGGKAGGGLTEELDGRRKADSVSFAERLLATLAAVEIGHLARADVVEMQDLEIVADVA